MPPFSSNKNATIDDDNPNLCDIFALDTEADSLCQTFSTTDTTHTCTASTTSLPIDAPTNKNRHNTSLQTIDTADKDMSKQCLTMSEKKTTNVLFDRVNIFGTNVPSTNNKDYILTPNMDHKQCHIVKYYHRRQPLVFISYNLNTVEKHLLQITR